MKRTLFGAVFLLIVVCLDLSVFAEPSVKSTMDGIVTRFYANLDEKGLTSLTQESVVELITEEERAVLATKYWYFDVNVPVVVSVIQNVHQPVAPFWLEESGFKKTDLVVTNSMTWGFDVWQKKFDAGRVELGINGFDMHRTVYFVCVGPQDTGAKVSITNLFPEGEAIVKMTKGAWKYRDWESLLIEDVPESLERQLLLTTFRGRAREAHLVGAFRTTPFPASAKPDHVILTWNDDPRTTQAIQWRSTPEGKTGLVRYYPKSTNAKAAIEEPAETVVLEDRLLVNDRYMHRHTAVLRSLKPATTYRYTVGSPDNNTWSEEAEFTTAPGDDTPFSFVFFGDTHRSEDWGRMLQAADARHPETAFYTIAGDVVSTGLYRDDWDKLFEYSGGVFSRKPIQFSLGNHDNQDGLGAWMARALTAYPENGPEGSVPERNYSFRYGNALFLMLDVDTPYEAQAKWMDEQLGDTDATWKIGMFHFPMYHLEEDDEYKDIRRSWEKVFAKHHMDLMLHGHVHYYLRTPPMRNGKPVESPADGTIYLVSLATKGRESKRKMRGHFVKYMNVGPWYQTIHIDGNRLAYRSFDADGNLTDEFSIEK